MFQNIIVAFLSAFLGLVCGYFTAMRSTTRMEAFHIFGQIKERLINCMLTIRSHENCPVDDVERIIPKIECLKTSLIPYLNFRSKRKFMESLDAFAYGNNPQHHDTRDTNHEYFSSDRYDVIERRKKVFSRIHNILKIKI